MSVLVHLQSKQPNSRIYHREKYFEKTLSENMEINTSERPCTARPLTESDIPDAVKYNSVLLKMSIVLLETCRGI
jgi:hypothetical protein